MGFFYWFLHQFDFGGTGGSTAEYKDWYTSLVQPFFAPPPWLFGLAWGIIYPLIVVALLYAIYLCFKKRLSGSFLALFVVNILLNLSFTPILIVTRNNALISLSILSVLITLAWLEVRAWKTSKLIFWLLVPYLLWGTFATVLQLSITALN